MALADRLMQELFSAIEDFGRIARKVIPENRSFSLINTVLLIKSLQSAYL